MTVDGPVFRRPRNSGCLTNILALLGQTDIEGAGHLDVRSGAAMLLRRFSHGELRRSRCQALLVETDVGVTVATRSLSCGIVIIVVAGVQQSAAAP